MTSTNTHPIHSRPTEELLAAGVTKEQVTALREISQVVLGDTDRVFDVLGLPESRGDAATMLGAFHAVRSKNPPMPGQQATYAEKIRSAIRTPSASSAKREEPTVTQSTTTTKTCIKCDKTKPADTDHFGSDSRTSDGLGRTCSECKTSAAKAAKSGNKRQKPKTKTPQGPAEKKSPDPPLSAGPPLSDSNGSTDFNDPRLSDLRAVQEILESTLPSVDAVHLEDVAVVLSRIGERFRRKGNDDS